LKKHSEEKSIHEAIAFSVEKKELLVKKEGGDGNPIRRI
jgi:hypothetical protein